jgi:hypothetical protein
MKVEFHNEADPDTVVAVASWDGEAVAIETQDETVAAQLATAYRHTPVVADDGAYRRRGTSGVAVIQPGDLEWFRAASQVRAPGLTGLVARLVPGVTEGGFDPAAGYRSFEEQVERLGPPPASRSGQ